MHAYNIFAHFMPVNPIALRMVKTLWSFGCSERNRVKACSFFLITSLRGKQYGWA